MSGLAIKGRARFQKVALLDLVISTSLILVLIPAPASSFSGGIVGQTRSGCTCHNMTESLSVTPSIAGLPGFYEPGEVYELDLGFTGGTANLGANVAGFDLSASAGELIGPKDSTTVRVDPSTGEATHTTSGNDEVSWKVRWRAPARDTGTVTLTFVVNSVNGDAAQGPGDRWGRVEVEVQEGGRGGIQDAPMFWSVVGIAAIIAIFGIAYLVTKGPRVELRK